MGLLALWLRPKPPNEMPTLVLTCLMRLRPANACITESKKKKVQATNHAQFDALASRDTPIAYTQ
jgi:hypothetical protein